MNPGEYIQPLTRKTIVNVPMVSGYTTSRLRITDSPFTAAGTDTINEFSVQGLFENVGTGNFTVSVMQSPDDGINQATRTTLVSGFQIVPGGHKFVDFNPTQVFIEMKCTAGNGVLRTQLDSRLRFEQMAFDKLDTAYPANLWQKIG